MPLECVELLQRAGQVDLLRRAVLDKRQRHQPSRLSVRRFDDKVRQCPANRIDDHTG